MVNTSVIKYILRDIYIKMFLIQPPPPPTPFRRAWITF